MKSQKERIKTKDKIGLTDVVKLKRMKPYIKPTEPHKHGDYIEIILITRGEGFHTVELNSYTVAPPVIFTLQPGQLHHWEFTEKPEGFVLMFKPKFLREFLLRSFHEFDIDQCLYLDQQTGNHLHALFNWIEKEFEEKRENYLHSIASYLNLSLIELERLSSEDKENRQVSGAKMQSFKHLVGIHFREKRKVNQYAEMLHISPKHLNDICKASTGKTASTLIFSHVCTEAKRLLIYTESSISEIAAQLGFDDSSHFAKFFKTQIGTSPMHFRKNRFQ